MSKFIIGVWIVIYVHLYLTVADPLQTQTHRIDQYRKSIEQPKSKLTKFEMVVNKNNNAAMDTMFILNRQGKYELKRNTAKSRYLKRNKIRKQTLCNFVITTTDFPFVNYEKSMKNFIITSQNWGPSHG